jgi:hypothetical protein
VNGDRLSWVDAFDRIPVSYSPPSASNAEPERAAIPLARHRRRARRRRALAHLRAAAHRVLVKLGARNTVVGSWLRPG